MVGWLVGWGKKNLTCWVLLQLMTELYEELCKIETDQVARVIILKGAGVCLL